MTERIEHFELSIPPMTGDIVFCTGNSLIKSVQAPAIFENRNVTHVAIMADYAEIAEAMARRTIRVTSIGNWLNERSKNGRRESYYVLRSEKTIGKALEIQRRIAFYLNEPYRVLPSFRDWMRPGSSICTSFVGKVLLTSDVTPHLQGRDTLLPGKLFRSLKTNGFREVSSKGFLNGARGISQHSHFDSALKLREILDELDHLLSDGQRKMIGWLSIVERDLSANPVSHLAVWIALAGKDIRSFCKDLSESVKVLLECIKILQEQGPQNWQDGFELHDERIELLGKLAAEQFELIRIFSDHLEFGQHLSAEDLEAVLPSASLEHDTKIYQNIAYYLGSIEVATRSIRLILGVT